MNPAEDARAILEEAVKVYRPVVLYALFSGGHDSLCSTHVAAQHPAFTAAVHINTGIGIERTRQFVRDTCQTFKWPLLEYHPPPFTPGRCPDCRRSPRQAPASWHDCPACTARQDPCIDYEGLPAYEALVLHHGFPGPGGHRLVYNRLKERCLRQLRRDTFPDGRRGQVMLLAGGMRSQESQRRMGNAVAMSLEAKEGRAWCAPVLRWSQEDKSRYLDAHGLPRNPVVGQLCMSGECLCGAFARPEEIVEIERCDPGAAERIRELEGRVRALGRHAAWGTRPPRPSGTKARRRPDPAQAELFGLCWTCNNKYPEGDTR